MRIINMYTQREEALLYCLVEQTDNIPNQRVIVCGKYIDSVVPVLQEEGVEINKSLNIGDTFTIQTLKNTYTVKIQLCLAIVINGNVCDVTVRD